MASLRVLAVAGLLTLLLPVVAAEGPQVRWDLPATPEGPVRTQWCDGNATNSAFDCVAVVLTAVPAAGPVAGSVARSAASRAEATCDAAAARGCALLNDAFFRYAHKPLDLATEKPFLLASCIAKYGLRCLPEAAPPVDLRRVLELLPLVCPSPTTHECFPV